MNRDTVERVARALEEYVSADFIHVGMWGCEEKDISGEVEEAAALLRALLAERDEARNIASEQRTWIEQEMSDGAPLIGFPWEAHP